MGFNTISGGRECAMRKFLSELDDQRQSVKNQNHFRNSSSAKINKIYKKKEETKKDLVESLLTRLYKRSLPFNDEYKATYDSELGEQFQTFMKPYCKNGSVYDYILSAKNHGSRPAKLLLESVDESVERFFNHFYENIDEANVDEIEMDDSSKENEIHNISLKMDYDQIGNIIMNNVKTTIMKEKQMADEEEKKIKEIEEQLSKDPKMVTESAIDTELRRHGLRGKVYSPTLFNGIMINKFNLFTESDDNLSDTDIQQMAFTESIKEYTGLSLLSTLSLENISGNNYYNLAHRYARSKK